MVLNKKNSEMKFGAIYDTLFDSRELRRCWQSKRVLSWISGYRVLPNRKTFLAFNIEKDRLDTFLAAHVYGVKKFSTLWNVMMFVFTMFYGQSNVERGFNINDDIVVENLKKESLIAQQLIYDHIHVKVVGVHDIVLTDKLRSSCLAYSSKPKQVLAENEKEKVLSEKEKTKERLTEEIGKVLQQVDKWAGPGSRWVLRQGLRSWCRCTDYCR